MALVGFAIAVGVGAAVGSSLLNRKAVRSRNRAERRARAIDRQVSNMENQRRVRQALADRRLRAAEIQQAGTALGTTGSSSVAGAESSLGAQTASNIGAGNILLAGNNLQASVLGRGYAQAAKLSSSADLLSTLGQTSMAIGQNLPALRSFGGRVAQGARGVAARATNTPTSMSPYGSR